MDVTGKTSIKLLFIHKFIPKNDNYITKVKMEKLKRSEIFFCMKWQPFCSSKEANRYVIAIHRNLARISIWKSFLTFKFYFASRTVVVGTICDYKALFNVTFNLHSPPPLIFNHDHKGSQEGGSIRWHWYHETYVFVVSGGLWSF